MEPSKTDSRQHRNGTTESIAAWELHGERSGYGWRKVKDRTVTVLATASVVIVMYPLLHIVGSFVYQGILALSIPRLVGLTLDGGLANSIAGTALLVGLSVVIAVPIGVLGGIYLAEFSGNGKYASVARFVADVLSAMPSILLGYVGFLILVQYFGWGFSPLAGAMTLAFLMLPYVIRTTERSLRKVPPNIREGAVALGSRRSQVVNKLTLRLALPGILTGVLLSISISLGETAPLLYTGEGSNFYPCGLTQCPVGFLTNVVYNFKNFLGIIPGYDSEVYLAVFLLLVFTLAINLVARIGLRKISKI